MTFKEFYKQNESRLYLAIKDPAGYSVFGPADSPQDLKNTASLYKTSIPFAIDQGNLRIASSVSSAEKEKILYAYYSRMGLDQPSGEIDPYGEDESDIIDPKVFNPNYFKNKPKITSNVATIDYLPNQL